MVQNSASGQSGLNQWRTAAALTLLDFPSNRAVGCSSTSRHEAWNWVTPSAISRAVPAPAASDRYVKSSVDQLTNPIAAVPLPEFAAACQSKRTPSASKAACALSQSVQASNAQWMAMR